MIRDGKCGVSVDAFIAVAISNLSCYFWSIISPSAKVHPNRTKNTEVQYRSVLDGHTKFHPNQMKNTEVENFRFWSILVGRAGRSNNGCSQTG